MPIDKYFARVSQQTFTAEELVGKTLAFYENGTEDSVTLTSELITIGTNYSIIKPSINGFSYVVVANENVSISGTNFTKGTWFLRTGDLTESPYSYAKSLTGVTITLTSETITKIDKKFIPITVSSSGVTDGTNTYNASDKQPIINSSNKLSADLIDDTNATHKFVTSSEKETWNGKQDELESGINIKTINGNSILGSGDMPVGGSLYRHSILTSGAGIINEVDTSIVLDFEFYSSVSTPATSFQDFALIYGFNKIHGGLSFVQGSNTIYANSVGIRTFNNVRGTLSIVFHNMTVTSDVAMNGGFTDTVTAV